MRKTKSIVASAIIGAITLLIQLPARADPIDPGFDLFMTVPASTSVDLTGIGAGVVSLAGVPIGPNGLDTVVSRTAGIDPFPVGGAGVVPIELVELSLTSVAPVSIGGLFFDLVVTELPSPPGTMTIMHEFASGGTFTAILPVAAMLTFTEVGNPLNVIPVPFFDIFTSSGVWSHTAAMDGHTLAYPSGGFNPGIDPLTGGKVLTEEEAMLAEHGVLPIMTPEPSEAMLLALGILGIIGLKKKF